MKVKKAFTLAEVLITLGIIGIVAMNVIPGIVYNYKKTVAIAKLKHTYAILQQAILRSVADNLGNAQVNFSDGDTQSMIDWYNFYLKPNLKVQADCFDEVGCWHSSGVTKMLNGQTALWDKGTKGIGGNIIVFKTIDWFATLFVIKTTKNRLGDILRNILISFALITIFAIFVALFWRL